MVDQDHTMYLRPDEAETLAALVEEGPLWDGDLPSKQARDRLLGRGMAVRVIVKGEQGWQAATHVGGIAYRAHFGLDPSGRDTFAEAAANRKAQLALRRAGSAA